MRRSKLILFAILLCGLYIPLTKLEAAGPYVVTIVPTSGNETQIGTYNDYNSAKNVMNGYNSTSEKVAVIKENGEIINAKYALVKLSTDPSNPRQEGYPYLNEHRLFPTASTAAEYTRTHSYYANEAAFLDYDNNNRRAQIKLSGYTGWINRGYYTIIPISKLQSDQLWIASLNDTWLKEIKKNTIQVMSSTPLSLRSGHATNATAYGKTSQGNTYQIYDKYYDGTYTWYRVSSYTTRTYYASSSSNTLSHYIGTYGGQITLNLGYVPNFLSRGTTYFSYDGNYYYTELKDMLNDYRDNATGRSENSGKPYYPYYLYLPNHTKTKYTANDFNQIVINQGYTSTSQSKLYGEGANFILSQEKHGVNALLTFSAAINESAFGTSAIAKGKNNLFGHHAFGENPYENAYSYASVADGIMAHAKMTGSEFNNPNDYRYYGGHYGNLGSGMNVKYATDPYWGEKAANGAFAKDRSFGSQDYNGNTVGVKKDTSSVPIKKSPDSNSPTIHILNNSSYNVGNMPITVIDKVYNNGKYWYKVYTDIALDSNQNIANVDYSFDKSYGYIDEQFLFVSNTQPIIVASDRTIQKGQGIDLMQGVIATDAENGTLTSKVKIDGQIYNNIPGTYRITYTVSDNQQFSVSKTVNVTVTGVSIPEIKASDKTVIQYTSFDPKEDVIANDGIDGVISSKVQVISNTVDIKTPGTYKVKYKVTNTTGQSVEKEITVTVFANEKPVISASDKSVQLNSTFNPLEDVTATDKEDGNLSKIEVTENTVNTKVLGTYKVTYKVTDAAGQITTKTIAVKVEKKVLKEKKAKYYLEYFKNVNGKLEFKGYNTIDGINNVLETKIRYKIIFESLDKKDVTYEQYASRITNKEEMGMPVFSEDGKDYTYSWFKFDFDFKILPEGNYRMYIVSETDDYYSKSVVSNKMFAPQATSFEGDKNVLIRNNYTIGDAPMEIVVRTEKIANRTTPTYSYNQFDQYLELSFNNDGKLHLKGTSYSYGSNLHKTASVSRNIIFENNANYKKYRYILDSITDGPYTVALPISDNLNKTKAWYNKDIDISEIKVGTYTLYISNNSNISDVAEFKDLFNRNLNAVTKKIGAKTYTFNLNQKNNNIELIVK